MLNMRALSTVSAAAVAVTFSVLATAAHARPMHVGIVPHYTRYLEERLDVQVELDAWMNKFQEIAGDNGWIPKSEARSADEQKEDQLQRFFLTKERIKELELENPDATFSTDSPFSLLTDDEFHSYVGNAYRKAEDAARKLRTEQGRPRGTNRRNGDRDTNGNRGGSSWSYQWSSSSNANVASDSDNDSDRSTTWSGAVPAHWLDWWNSVTTNHASNNNYVPETVAPFNPDTPVTAAPTADSDNSSPVVAPDTPAADNNDDDNDNSNSLPVAPDGPSNEDNALTQAPDSTGYDFNSATTAPVAADADASNQGAGSIDWSKSVCNAPIQNQGQCGSCWAFASIAAVESAQCIASGQKSLTKYSEQQLASCDSRNYGCNGGAPVYAFEYIQKNGVCTADAFPYTSTNGRNIACSTSCQKIDVGIKGYAKVTGEDGLLSTLGQHPVVVAVAAGNNAWKQYTGGVLSVCDTNQVDHAVLAVGYDSDTIKIKNSWGNRWGEAGYIRIKRGAPGQGTCGVFTDMSHPLV